MKKNILAAAAVVFAITLSSFTAKTTTSHYAVFDRDGLETEFENYSFPQSEPSTDDEEGDIAVLNWFKLEAAIPNGVTELEFTTAFDGYDVGPTEGTLTDEVEIEGALDLALIEL